MTQSSPLTFCISTHNNLEYLKWALFSVRKNSYYKEAPLIVHAENCTDGTNEWLRKMGGRYNLTCIIEPNNQVVKGIGGGMNACAEHVETEFICFLHSDFYVTKNWDKYLLDTYHTSALPNEDLWVNSCRVEPNTFNSPVRPGTAFVELDHFGSNYKDFQSEQFEQWVAENHSFFVEHGNIPKGEGVSGLVKKAVWDAVGGNDPQFAPTSYDDMDLFVRMKIHGVRFVMPHSSVVWHFGARGSHRLEENDGKSSQRQVESEQANARKWFDKWGENPQFDEWGMVKIPQSHYQTKVIS